MNKSLYTFVVLLVVAMLAVSVRLPNRLPHLRLQLRPPRPLNQLLSHRLSP